jgi:hypothetical protein
MIRIKSAIKVWSDISNSLSASKKPDTKVPGFFFVKLLKEDEPNEVKVNPPFLLPKPPF